MTVLCPGKRNLCSSWVIINAHLSVCSLVQVALDWDKHLQPQSLFDSYRALCCSSLPPLEVSTESAAWFQYRWGLRNSLPAFFGWDKLCIGKRTRKFWQPITFLEGASSISRAKDAVLQHGGLLSKETVPVHLSLDNKGMFYLSASCWAPWTTSLWHQVPAEFLRASPGEKAGSMTAPLGISPQVLHVRNLKLPKLNTATGVNLTKAKQTILYDRV